MNKEQIVTILILMRLFGGLVGEHIASLLDYNAPPVNASGYSSFQNLLDLHAPVFGILWKIKEKAMMKENCDDILRGSLDPTRYRLPVMTLLFLKRLNDTFEETAENC